MVLLIKNIYYRNNYYHYELIDNLKNSRTLKRTTKIYAIGDFVEGMILDNKVTMDEEVGVLHVPSNFLDYYEHGKMSGNELKLELGKYINKITNPNFISILDETINKSDDFYLFPAAKSIHHAYIGGLAEHTLNILKLSDGFINLYDLDYQLLYTAILLHDYAKIYELTKYGLNYSLAGNLLGHISMLNEEISYIARLNDINDENDIVFLKHLILSHHGKLEYGSPKEPMIIEAYVLSVLDDCDAKINSLEKELKSSNKYELSAPINSFDRRRFIKIK